MIKVPSVGSLAAARSPWRPSTPGDSGRAANASHSRRRSIDIPTNRPTPRGSSHDLVSLDTSACGNDKLSRPQTPAIIDDLFTLVESPVGSYADDALSYINKYAAELDASRAAVVDSSHKLAALEVQPAAAASVVVTAAPPAFPPAPELPSAAAVSTAMAPPEPIAVVAAAAPAPSSTKRAKAPCRSDAVRPAKVASVAEPTPALPPKAGEVHIYHAHLGLTYVQELLGNLSHLQSMIRGVAGTGSSTAAAAAMAAARMLSRSLARAAARVRGSVTDPAAVLLAHEALYTLTEFGWSELITQDPAAAAAMGALDLEVHDLATRRVATYHRAAPDQPWVHIGVSSTSADAVAAALGSGGPVDAAGTARGGLTVAGLADQLQAAGASVLAAGQQLQQWLDDHKSAAAAAMMSAMIGESGAAAPVNPTPRSLPPLPPPRANTMVEVAAGAV